MILKQLPFWQEQGSIRYDRDRHGRGRDRGRDRRHDRGRDHGHDRGHRDHDCDHEVLKVDVNSKKVRCTLIHLRRTAKYAEVNRQAWLRQQDRVINLQRIFDFYLWYILRSGYQEVIAELSLVSFTL